MSPEAKKEWPCVFHYTKEGGCLKGKDCPYSHNPKHKRKLDNEKGKGKGGGKAPRTPSPKRDGVCYALREGSAQKGINASRSMQNQQTPRHPLQHRTPNNRQRHKPSPKQQLQQL